MVEHSRSSARSARSTDSRARNPGTMRRRAQPRPRTAAASATVASAASPMAWSRASARSARGENFGVVRCADRPAPRGEVAHVAHHSPKASSGRDRVSSDRPSATSASTTAGCAADQTATTARAGRPHTQRHPGAVIGWPECRSRSRPARGDRRFAAPHRVADEGEQRDGADDDEGRHGPRSAPFRRYIDSGVSASARSRMAARSSSGSGISPLSAR